MRKRILSLLLTMILLLLLPVVCAESYYDGLFNHPVVPEDGPLTVEVVIGACKDAQLSVRTELMLALHDYFLSEMSVSAREMELETAKSEAETRKTEQLMGLADTATVETAQLAVDLAQAEYDKAVLEQLKAATIVRGYTELDITEREINAEEAYLTLQPSQISLEELKNAALSALQPTEDSTLALIEIEQNYIDITLYYAQIGTAAAAYRTACTERDDMAMAMVMGNADALAFRNATMNMKYARLELMRAISDYSKLLYRVNELCGGLLVQNAGKLTTVLGN